MSNSEGLLLVRDYTKVACTRALEISFVTDSFLGLQNLLGELALVSELDLMF